MGASELERSASIISQCSCNIKNEESNFSNEISSVNLDKRDEENNITLQVFKVVEVETCALTSLMDRIAEQLREEARRLRQEEEEARQREKHHDESGASA